MLEDSIKARLKQKDLDPGMLKLQEEFRKLLKRSRGGISKSYTKWDRNIAVYRGNRLRDEKDLQAADANEPEKFVVPLSYAQVQTFASFGFMLLKQNETFYEMAASGAEDEDISDLIERGLERDLVHNQWNAKLYQWLLDMARTGCAPIKHWWTVDTQQVKVATPMSIDDMGIFTSAAEQEIEAISYEGNRVRNISPYRIRPDMRMPLTRWQEGTFIGDEDEWHITNVKALELKNIVSGTEWVRPLEKNSYKEQQYDRFSLVESGFAQRLDESDFMCIYCEGNAMLVPQKYGLGRENYPVMFTFRIANERLVGIERTAALHGGWNYDIGQFSADSEAKLNECLSDTVHFLQETVTWLYNSRIESVRRTLDSHMVVHPAYVDVASLESRSPIVYLTKNAPVNDIRALVHQLDIRDTTTNHFGDADTLLRTMQFVTGVNENAMGQYATGRRSATENRAANSSAAARMKMILSVAWDSCLGPLGKKLMINQRQGFSFQTYQKVFGKSEKVAALWPVFAPEDPRELVGCEDFLVFDSTMNSEKGFVAQSLQELISVMISNPEMAMASGFDLEKAVETIQKLRGVRNVDRFFTRPTAMGNPGAGTPPPGVGNVPGAGSEQVVGGPTTGGS